MAPATKKTHPNFVIQGVGHEPVRSYVEVVMAYNGDLQMRLEVKASYGTNCKLQYSETISTSQAVEGSRLIVSALVSR